MELNEKENRYIKAKKRVAEIKKFYTSLISYVVFITFLAALNYYVNEFRHPWFLWAAFGWGIGLLFQGMRAFHCVSFFGKDWEEKKLKKFMEEEERNSRNF